MLSIDRGKEEDDDDEDEEEEERSVSDVMKKVIRGRGGICYDGNAAANESSVCIGKFREKIRAGNTCLQPRLDVGLAADARYTTPLLTTSIVIPLGESPYTPPLEIGAEYKVSRRAQV